MCAMQDSRPGPDQLSRRRFLQAAGLGAGAMALPVGLLACGQSGSSSSGSGGGASQPGQLNVVVGKDTAHPQEQSQILDAVAKAFAKQHPGSTVTFDTYATAGEEVTKLETAAASHEGPDIMEFGSTVVPTAFATGAFDVLTAEQWTQLGGRDAFFKPQLTLSGPSPDKLMAVPVTGNPFAMVYNQRLFQEAGVSRPPTTWNEFVTAARALTKPEKDQWGVAMAPADGFDPWHKIWLFVTQMGGSMLSADGRTGRLDSNEVVQACAFWLDWMARFKIASPQNATFKGPDQLQAFANEKVAMLVMEGPGDIVTFDKSPVAGHYVWTKGPTVPYGMSKVPSKGRPAQTFVSGQYWSIFKYGKHKQLALDLIKIYLSPDIQYQTWKLRGQQPVILETFKKYPETRQGAWSTFYDAETAAYPTPFSGAWGQLEVVLGQAINKSATQIATAGGYSRDDLKQALTAANQQLAASLQH